jgi:mono/diheme cytochrome c family protein
MKLTRLLVPAALTAVGVLPLVSNVVSAQKPLTPPLVISSLSGRDLFQFYCSSCHGREGKGDGPVAAQLKRQPPDLTTIALRNGGHFPSEAIERLVAGEDEPVEAHGSREMPVWGPIFRSLEPHDRLTRIRIANTVTFVESLQSGKSK